VEERRMPASIFQRRVSIFTVFLVALLILFKRYNRKPNSEKSGKQGEVGDLPFGPTCTTHDKSSSDGISLVSPSGAPEGNITPDDAFDPERETHSRLVEASTGKPGSVVMEVCINVLAMWNIDTVEQRFSCEFVLRLRTFNMSAMRTSSGNSVTHVNWEPRIRVLNLIEAQRWKMRPRTLEQGELEYKYGITGVLAEPFQLALFPFDTQTLTITISRLFMHTCMHVM
jgi:hypothetical protein